MKSLDYILGFFTGFLLVVIVAVVLVIILKKNKLFNTKYDERQQLARGKAFKAAFVTLFAYLCISGLFDFIFDIKWADYFVEVFIGICISATVFASISILNDAYLPLRESKKSWIILFSFIGVCNLALGIFNVIDGNMLTDGILNFHSNNLIIAAVFFIIIGVFIWKNAIDKKTDEAE